MAQPSLSPRHAISFLFLCRLNSTVDPLQAWPNRNCFVVLGASEMWQWEDGQWCWEIEWRRDLLDRKKAGVEEMMAFLSDFTLREAVADCWAWSGNASGKMKVKEAYAAAGDRSSSRDVDGLSKAGFGSIWKMCAPLKAQVMAWRLIWNRLATRDNLKKRLGDNMGEVGCCCYSQSMEMAQHIFLECKDAQNL